jgi:hypothetical protein
LNKYKQKLIGGKTALRIVERLLFAENLYPMNTIDATIKSRKLKTIINITVYMPGLEDIR